MDDQTTNVNNQPLQKPEGGEGVGPVIGSIIIIIIIILGGFYFLNQRVDKVEETEQTGSEIKAQEDGALTKLETQGSSDEIVDIEEDLGLTDLENLDAELENIDAELSL